MRGTSALRCLGMLSPYVLLFVCVCSVTAWCDVDQTYYYYIEDHPSDVETYFSSEAQGLAHSGNHWYITDHSRLIRAPLGLNLAILNPGGHVQVTNINDVKPLWDIESSTDYEPKFNDLDCYQSGDHAFVVVPVEYQERSSLGRGFNSALECPDFCPRIAVFTADASLRYVASEGLAFKGIPWCAVRPDGMLYLSNNDIVDSIYRFTVAWDLLAPIAPSGPRLELEAGEEIHLQDYRGKPVKIMTIQGGDFSEDGRYLYLASDTGIRVFDMETYDNGAIKMVMQSEPKYESPDETPPAGPSTPLFAYRLEGGSFGPYWPWEAEGVDVWDLDDGTAPDCGAWSDHSCGAPVYRRCSGQLHAIVLDNNAGKDQVLIKHYTNAITIDAAYTGDEHEGTVYHPFTTVTEAMAFYHGGDAAGWNGAKLRIRGGSYREAPLAFGTHAASATSKRMQLASYGGTAVIGDRGRVALHPSGEVNVNGGGGLTIR